jgi:hypothetical protein
MKETVNIIGLSRRHGVSKKGADYDIKNVNFLKVLEPDQLGSMTVEGIGHDVDSYPIFKDKWDEILKKMSSLKFPIEKTLTLEVCKDDYGNMSAMVTSID